MFGKVESRRDKGSGLGKNDSKVGKGCLPLGEIVVYNQSGTIRPKQGKIKAMVNFEIKRPSGAISFC